MRISHPFAAQAADWTTAVGEPTATPTAATPSPKPLATPTPSSNVPTSTSKTSKTGAKKTLTSRVEAKTGMTLTTLLLVLGAVVLCCLASALACALPTASEAPATTTNTWTEYVIRDPEPAPDAGDAGDAPERPWQAEMDRQDRILDRQQSNFEERYRQIMRERRDPPAFNQKAVSYTHLTLPTIYSV